MHAPQPGSQEDKLMQVLKKPKDWAVDTLSLAQVPFDQLLKEIARRSDAAKPAK
jgi:hypothetical protein